jgi:ABC-type branched-subunit amino acid transport system permease subunit
MEQAIQTIIGGLLQGSVFAVVALGFSLVFRVTGAINLSQGAFCIVGALVMYSFQMSLGWPVALAAAAAIATTAAAGAAIGAAAFVPALPRLPVSSMLILTAGLLTTLEGFSLVVWGSQPYALPPFSGEAPVAVLGVRLPTQGFWIAGTALAIIAAVWFLLMRTPQGLALRACAENPTAARLMGIDVPRMTLLSFTLAALIAGIGGIVVAPILSFQFDTGRFFTISGFSAVAIGGLASFVGAVAGGVILGVAEQLAAGYISSVFADGIALGLLILTLLARPSGLFTARKSRREDVRDEHRIYHAIVRLRGRGALVFGLAAAGIILALPWIAPAGLMSSLVITGILFIGVLGLDVLMGYAGQVSLGQAGFMAVGGYTSAILATGYGWPPLAGILAGIVLSLACAVALSLVTVRLRGHYLALGTLAFGLLVDSLTVGMTEVTGGPSGLVGIPSFSIGPIDLGTPIRMYYLVAGLMIALVLVLLGGIRSGFGRALQAVRTDQTAAGALGINVARYKMAALAISATLAALSGSLYAFYFHFLSPEMVGTARSLEMIAMLVVGGEGTLVGPLLGVALLTLLPTVFQPLAQYKILAEGLLLVLVVRYLPGGIFGTLAQGMQGMRSARPAGGTA